MKHILYVCLIMGAFFSSSVSAGVDVHGFITQGAFVSTEVNYLAENSISTSLKYREVGINFQSQVNDRLRVGMQLLSRDVGVYGNSGNLVVDWAYADFFVFDFLNIAMGRVKNKMAFYTDIQDFDFLRTWAVLPKGIYDPGLRTLYSSVDGLQLHGNFQASALGSFDYALTVGRIALGKQSDIKPYVKQYSSYDLEAATIDYITSNQLIWNTPLDGLRLNFSFTYMDNISFDPVAFSIPTASIPQIPQFPGMPSTFDGVAYLSQDIEIWLAGFQYLHTYFELTGEWMHHYHTNRRQMEFPSLPPSVPTPPGPPPTSNTRMGGGYLGFSVPVHDMVHLGAYYQFNLANYAVKKSVSSNQDHDMALSLAFLPVTNMVIKFEGHLVQGTGGVSKGLNPDLDKDSIDSWKYGIAKVSYNF